MQRDAARSRGLIVVVCALALSMAPGAQDQPARTFRTDANYIRVDLYPTQNGVPVTDLRTDDVEILDEGVPQKIDRFEHVLVRGAGLPQVVPDVVPTAIGTPAATPVAGTPTATPVARSRFFVLFLDTLHVDLGPSLTISRPLASALDALIGVDDLIAVMTPQMTARDLTFSRRKTGVDGVLRAAWGARDRSYMRTPEEAEYAACWPGPDGGTLVQQMILRRREVLTLDALEALVGHLGAIGEERKAVIAISNGWRLFDEGSGRLEPAATPQEIDSQVKPRPGIIETSSGRITPRCQSALLALSRLDNKRRFREVLDMANRTNTSFYPIDPRGVTVFDDDIVPVAGAGGENRNLSLTEERTRLGERRDALLDMAQSTDGLAVVNTNDIDVGFRRIADDVSSYYLAGYYTTQKLDGKFHRLTVRVKRPGVQVRARRGYLAFTPAPTTAPGSTTSATTSAVDGTLAELSLVADRPLRLQAAAGWTGAGAGAIWVVMEERPQGGRSEWKEGAQVEATVLDATGTSVGSETLSVAAGSTSLRVKLQTGAPLQPGEYEVRIRAKGAGAGALTATDTVRVALPAAPAGSGALFTKRGPTTANRDVVTGDRRFRRTERITVEVPAASADAGSARLLDRTGKPLPIPVTTAVREDVDGTRWRTAQVTLAPLAPGDYVIEMTAGSERALTALRVLP